jgi:hypothetical protein
MDFDYVRWGEAQRVFGNLENVRLEKSVIRNGEKSVNLCHIRAVVWIAGNTKPQLITVGVSYLVAIINMKSRSELAQFLLGIDGS